MEKCRMYGRKAHIVALCGLGDYITFVARIKKFREMEGIEHLILWVGGHGKMPEKIKSIIEKQEGINEVKIIDNFSQHNQVDTVFKYIKGKKTEKADLVQDWSFVKEIFTHQEVPFLKYDIQYPFELKMSDEDRTWADKFFETRGLNEIKTVCVHPVTKEGNVEGFNYDIQAGRFWDKVQYKEMIKKFLDNDYVVLLMGIPGEEWGLDELVDDKNMISCIGLDIPKTIAILQRSKRFFGCNSWDWEVVSRSGGTAFAFYTKNEFFIKLHLPQFNQEYFRHTHIETDRWCPVEAAWRMWQALEERRNLSEEIKVSCCMIAQNCVADVGKVIRNVKNHVDEIVVVDGESKDGTGKIAQHLGAKVIEHSFENDFAAQKNIALENCQYDWRLLVDSDEIFHSLFLHQMKQWIWMYPDHDCFYLPRENVVMGLTEEEIKARNLKIDEMQRMMWNDPQGRLMYKWYRFFGTVHEQLVIEDKWKTK